MTPVDGDDYTYANALYHPDDPRDLRTADQKNADDIVSLALTVQCLSDAVQYLSLQVEALEKKATL